MISYVYVGGSEKGHPTNKSLTAGNKKPNRTGQNQTRKRTEP